MDGFFYMINTRLEGCAGSARMRCSGLSAARFFKNGETHGKCRKRFVLDACVLIFSKNATLMVGTTIVELENISGSIVIDSALQEAYQGTTLMNDHMNGEFPRLKPGANAISWTGTVTKVVVRPNWRYL